MNNENTNNNGNYMNQQFNAQTQGLSNNQPNNQVINNNQNGGMATQQQMNNQITNQQFMGQQSVQGINSNQMLNNNQFNNINQGVQNSQMINNQYQNPINNQQYMNQPNPGMPNKQKNNKGLFIIIGSIILGVIVLVVIILLLTNGNKTTKNDYEDNDNSNTTNNSVQNNDTIKYNGFEFIKKSGYQYSTSSEGLVIGNSNFAVLLDIIAGDFNQIKTQCEAFINQYNSSGIAASNCKLGNYGSKEMFTIELTYSTQSYIYFVTSLNSNYLITGAVMNPDYTIDYSLLNTSVDLISDAKQTENFKSNSSSQQTMEFKDLFK